MPDRFGQPWRFGEAVRRSVEEHSSKLAALHAVRRVAVEGQEARRKLEAMGLGSGKMAGSIVSGIQDAVKRAMSEAQAQIGGATDELVAEIRSGAANVKRAIQAEVLNVRKEFGEVVGNAAAAAQDAVNDAKKLATDATQGETK